VSVYLMELARLVTQQLTIAEAGKRPQQAVQLIILWPECTCNAWPLKWACKMWTEAARGWSSSSWDNELTLSQCGALLVATFSTGRTLSLNCGPLQNCRHASASALNRSRSHHNISYAVWETELCI